MRLDPAATRSMTRNKSNQLGKPPSDHDPILQIDPILRIRDVVRVTGLSKTSLYRLIAEGAFPPPVQLGRQAVGWRGSSIQRWNENLEEVPLDAGPWAVRREPAADRRAASERGTPRGRR